MLPFKKKRKQRKPAAFFGAAGLYCFLASESKTRRGALSCAQLHYLKSSQTLSKFRRTTDYLHTSLLSAKPMKVRWTTTKTKLTIEVRET
jgi:hypothetical protein